MSIDKGTLNIMAPYEITEVRVLDEGLREVAAGTHALRVELAPGIYQVQARIPGGYAQKLVGVEAGSTVFVQDLQLNFDSATPLPSAQSTHEYHMGPAESYSKQTHLKIGDNPQGRLFLFARTKGDARTEVPSFTLRDRNGAELASFPKIGAVDLSFGWLALSLELPGGTYMIEQEVPRLGQRGQALIVEDQWETQVFASWDAAPDFGFATIYIQPKGRGFQPNVGEYSRTEAALMGLARGKLVLHPTDIDDFLLGKFHNPMLGLIGAYALLDQNPVDYGRMRIVAENLLRLLPHNSDARLISLIANSDGAWPPPQPEGGWPKFEEPPLFAVGTNRLIRLAAVVEELCPSDSWLAEVSLLLTSGSAWTRWESGIETPSAIARFQTELRVTVNRYVESLSKSIHLRGLPQSVVGNALRAMLEGSAPLMVKVLKGFGIKPSTLFEKAIQQMAQELAPRVELPLSVVKNVLNQIMEGERLQLAITHSRMLRKAKKATTKRASATASKKSAAPARGGRSLPAVKRRSAKAAGKVPSKKESKASATKRAKAKSASSKSTKKASSGRAGGKVGATTTAARRKTGKSAKSSAAKNKVGTRR